MGSETRSTKIASRTRSYDYRRPHGRRIATAVNCGHHAARKHFRCSAWSTLAAVQAAHAAGGDDRGLHSFGVADDETRAHPPATPRGRRHRQCGRQYLVSRHAEGSSTSSRSNGWRRPDPAIQRNSVDSQQRSGNFLAQVVEEATAGDVVAVDFDRRVTLFFAQQGTATFGIRINGQEIENDSADKWILHRRLDRYFFDTRLTDSGLAHLRPLTELRILHLGKTGVTFAGASAFEQNLPRSPIIR